IGSHDDPVIMETEYLADEAFITTPTANSNITSQFFQECNQLQHKQKESSYMHHHQKRPSLMKQTTLDCNTKDDNWHSTSITTSTTDSADICKVVSCCVDIPIVRKNRSSSKFQRKSMDCTKLLTSKCRDLSLIDWKSRQIIPASSYPGLFTATTITTVPLNKDVE
ncbi:unnamed protein product, partial [Schistosoma turkestanicum]